jgi:hypothetical protein
MDVLVVVPVMGCLVTAFNDGVSAESKVILTSWSLAKTSRATTAGEGAEQEYDTNGILISNLIDGQCPFEFCSCSFCREEVLASFGLSACDEDSYPTTNATRFCWSVRVSRVSRRLSVVGFCEFYRTVNLSLFGQTDK